MEEALGSKDQPRKEPAQEEEEESRADPGSEPDFAMDPAQLSQQLAEAINERSVGKADKLEPTAFEDWSLCWKPTCAASTEASKHSLSASGILMCRLSRLTLRQRRQSCRRNSFTLWSSFSRAERWT